MNKGLFEFRDNHGQDRSPEIIAWDCDDLGSDPFCYTVCWFKEDSEGYYLQSVSDRIVNHCGNQEDLTNLIEYAFTVLNARFRLNDL
jgi:hypothetical protein